MTERTPLKQGSLDNLAQDISEVIAHVAELERLTGLVGTAKDSATVRRELKAVRDRAAAVTNEASKAIKLESRTTGRSKQDQQRYEKLVQQFSQAAQQCHQVSKQSLLKENKYTMNVPDEEPRESYEGGWGGQKVSTQRFLEKRELSIDRNIVEETNREYKELEGELGALGEAYRDVADLLAEQGIVLNQTESNVTNAEINTYKAVDELQTAAEYQQSSRIKILILVVCCLVVLLAAGGGVAGFLAYEFTK